ncbi:MAG: MATE family efflux transporter [Lachnospiraceae bacterium]|nr:MATE family efflux transporter [Lachnospiraceae bacterium]
MTLGIAVPIMIQNGITNFVSLLDNIMVGQIGTEQMSGIAIVNQLLLVFNLAIFGAVSGAGIFTAQFYGKKDHEGVRHTFRFKIYIAVLITLLGILILSLAGGSLIEMYLRGEDNGFSIEEALRCSRQYLWIMYFGLLPFAIEQAYVGTLRECGETVVPMIAGVIAVVLNLVLNYILIFGKLGCPALGVVGAALATIISRYVEAAIVIVWTHRHRDKMPFIVGAFSSWKVPGALTKQIIWRGTPLMVNEVLWAAGIAMISQCYSMSGFDAVAVGNIASTISNIFNISFIAFGDAIAIVVGQHLGAGRFKEAKDTDTKLITFCVVLCVGLGIILYIAAPLFPELYKTTDEVKELATRYLRVSALFMPVWAFMHASYFTLRSGGKTVITFLFDSVYLWVIAYPVAYVLSRYTGMSLIPMYACVQSIDIIKCIIGFILVKKGVWINNIVTNGAGNQKNNMIKGESD